MTPDRHFIYSLRTHPLFLFSLVCFLVYLGAPDLPLSILVAKLSCAAVWALSNDGPQKALNAQIRARSLRTTWPLKEVLASTAFCSASIFTLLLIFLWGTGETENFDHLLVVVIIASFLGGLFLKGKPETDEETAIFSTPRKLIEFWLFAVICFALIALILSDPTYPLGYAILVVSLGNWARLLIAPYGKSEEDMEDPKSKRLRVAALMIFGVLGAIAAYLAQGALAV